MDARTLIVGLGSNLGARAGLLRSAEAWLAATPGCRLVARSPLYRTPPVGPPQPDYLNAALRLETSLEPLAVLERARQLEAWHGRQRTLRWGPRTLDLDLLWWGGGAVDHPDLQLPHPRLSQRSFALAPVLDVAPELTELEPLLAAQGGRPELHAPPQVSRSGDWLRVPALDLAEALSALAWAWLERAGRGPDAGVPSIEPFAWPDAPAALAALSAGLQADWFPCITQAGAGLQGRWLIRPSPRTLPHAPASRFQDGCAWLAVP